jgi:hypothetical protein
MSAIVNFVKETLRGNRNHFAKRRRQRARFARALPVVEVCAIAAADILHDRPAFSARAVFMPKRTIARLVLGLLIVLSSRCEVTFYGGPTIHIDYDRTAGPASLDVLRCLTEERINGPRMRGISLFDSVEPSAMDETWPAGPPNCTDKK